MYIEELQARLQANWGGISGARSRTDALLDQLRTLLSDLEDPVAAVVVTGSLGRGEVTFDQATTEETYMRLRELSGTFREGINMLFFDDHRTLRRLIRQYGVF